MIKNTSQKQISIEEFKTPFQFGLDPNNRWVRLAEKIPWDELAAIYSRSLRKDFGRPAKSPRIVIGAMIIKHMLRLSDEETIRTILENPYLQFFIGYEEFSHKKPFDPSLFVSIRKRLGQEAFNDMNNEFISRLEALKEPKPSKVKKSKNDDSSNFDSKKDSAPKNQGQLILDATVAPADIKYPTDLDLLNTARQQSERLIDILWDPGPDKVKPRTYRRRARQDYLALARQRRKDPKKLRKAIRKQLNYTNRNVKTINDLLDEQSGAGFPLEHPDLRLFWIIQEVYRQQKTMYDERTHQVSNRIVSVSQPHVRPIVRGKAGKNVEFGAKLSASLINGYVFLDRIGWDPFNESTNLVGQVERYRDRFGYFPEVVSADKIYGTRKNRLYLKEHQIRFSGRRLGRPLDETKLTKSEIRRQKKQRKQDSLIRNHIEGKFGEGKRSYDLHCVKAKRIETSESWIATIFFVMNLARWLREDFFVFFSLLFQSLILRLQNYHTERERAIFAK
jgi:hypothetical protein